MEATGLTYKEALAVLLALDGLITDFEKAKKDNGNISWTEEAKTHINDVLVNAKSAKAKIHAGSGIPDIDVSSIPKEKAERFYVRKN